MDHASWTGLPSNSAGAGPDARPGLRPAAGAGPLGPIGAAGETRPVGSAIPHNEHWADGKEWLRSSRCVAIDESPHVNWRLIAGPPALRTPWTEASPKLARQMWP